MQSKLRRISVFRTNVLEELHLYLNKTETVPSEPRSDLLKHNPNNEAWKIPVTMHDFPFTHNCIALIFSKKFVDSFILVLSPGTDYAVWRQPNSKVYRCYIPIARVGSYNTGLWTESKRVQHFHNGSVHFHKQSENHSLFNYSENTIYILVIDVLEQNSIRVI